MLGRTDDPGRWSIASKYGLLNAGGGSWYWKPLWRERAASDDPELTEMVVPVEWFATRPIDEAVWEKGLFASQLTVCKLRDENTIKTAESAFGLDSTID